MTRTHDSPWRGTFDLGGHKGRLFAGGHVKVHWIRNGLANVDQEYFILVQSDAQQT